MFLKAKLPIWVFITVTAIGIAVMILLIQYKSSVLNEMNLQSVEDAYWTKTIHQKETLSDWKTYRNTEFGFEIKYPPNYELDYKEKGNAFSIGNETILLTEKAFNFEKAKDKYKIVSKKDIKLNGYDGIEYSIEVTDPEEQGEVFLTYGVGTYTVIEISATKDKILTLIVNPNADKNLINQILSTFKFIEPIDTSDWKTYRNETTGIEFRYPAQYGKITTEFKDSSLQSQGVIAGQTALLRFDNAQLSISAISKDYQGWMDPYWFKYSEKPEDLCPKEVQYEEDGSVCKIMDSNKIKMVFGNYFYAPECSPMFGSYIYINNPNNVIYKTIIFTISYDSGSDILNDYDCTDNTKNEKINQKLKLFSQNIIEQKGLNEKDTQFLREINQILSTFKFIK